MPEPTTLLEEVRALAMSEGKEPVILIGLPRWAALRLGRERAEETGKGPLVQAHADALRDRSAKQEPSCILWLDLPEHPFKGVHILCNRGFEAGLLMAWRYREPLMHPRTFTEFPRVLMPWRSDQQNWTHPALVIHHMQALVREATKRTRRDPAAIQPSPALMETIRKAHEDVNQPGQALLHWVNLDKESPEWKLASEYLTVLAERTEENGLSVLHVEGRPFPPVAHGELPPMYKAMFTRGEDGSLTVDFAPLETVQEPLAS